MLHATLLLALAVPQTSGWQVLPSGSWGAGPPASTLPLLERGTHVSLGDRTARELEELEPLGAARLLGLLDDAVREAGIEVELQPLAPPLLARGEPRALTWLREEALGLEAAVARRNVHYEAFLLPGLVSLEGARSRGADPSTSHWEATASSGQALSLGTREQRAFLADYQVNVATDSGVAEPVVGVASSGRTLHVQGSRCADGTRVHLRAWLDLCELEDIEVFETDSPDLGRIEEPRLRSVSLAFSGVVSPGEALVVELEGTPLSSAAWTLYLFAESAPEPPELGEHGWRALDLDLFTRRSWALPSFGADGGAEHEARLPALRGAFEPSTAGGLMAAVEPRGRGSRSGAGETRAPRFVGEHVFLTPARGAGVTHSALRELLEALEGARLVMERIELEHGPLRARFPLAHGEPARLIVGEERTLLVDYSAEIAPNTWMPQPIVRRSFDGLAWQGRLLDRVVDARALETRTRELHRQDRRAASLGAMQVTRRDQRLGAGRATLQSPARLWPAKGEEPELSIALEERGE